MCNRRTKIIIIGGRPAQRRMMADARRNGFEVVGCIPQGSSLSADEADRVYYAAPNDCAALLAIAEKEQADGVVSNLDDAMGAVAHVSTELGLVGNTPEAVGRLQNKYLFRQLQRSCNIFAPDLRMAESEEKFVALAKEIGFPAIIKPCESAGSRGVKKIDEYDEAVLRENFKICALFSRSKQVMIEEYVPRGLTNLECDVFVHRGEILYLGYETNICAPEKPLQPRGGMFPADVTDEQKRQFESTTGKLLRAAGITHGMYNIEAVFTPTGEVFIIEINARMAGATVPEVILRHNGVNVYRLLCSTATGDDTYFEEVRSAAWKNNYVTSFELFPYSEGTFREVYLDSVISPYVYDKNIWGHMEHMFRKRKTAVTLWVKCILNFRTGKHSSPFYRC